MTIPLRTLDDGTLVEAIPDIGHVVQLSDNTLGKVVAASPDDKTVTIDTNHEFAGRDLRFEVTVVAIEDEETRSWSGVSVETISAGDGKTYPSRGDRIAVHYVGTLASTGKVFDNSHSRGPLKFIVGAGRVIRGWDEGFLKISLGERAKMYIASDFAYADKAAGPIPPNSNLVFEVELVEINGKTA